MKRFPLLAAGFAAALALLPASASAQIATLGQTRTPVVAPTCPKGVSPGQCVIILERTTAVQTTSDGVSNPMTVKRNGWIVSFTVGLAQLSSNPSTERHYLHALDKAYGGTPQMAISVLQPGPGNRYKVIAQSQTFHLIPFLGQVLDEPLSLPPTFTTFTALPVRTGDVIGLTTPTWAPILSYNLSASRFSYRQSRQANCKNPPAGQTAQATGQTTRYLCEYTGTRVEYTATEVVNTQYPRRYVH